MTDSPFLRGLFDGIEPINELATPEKPLLNRCAHGCDLPEQTRKDPKPCRKCGNKPE